MVISTTTENKMEYIICATLLTLAVGISVYLYTFIYNYNMADIYMYFYKNKNRKVILKNYLFNTFFLITFNNFLEMYNY